MKHVADRESVVIVTYRDPRKVIRELYVRIKNERKLLCKKKKKNLNEFLQKQNCIYTLHI